MTWGINMVIFSHMILFLYNKCAKHPVRGKRPHFQKFMPVYVLTLGSMLIMFDLTRHLVNDAWGTTCMDRVDGTFPSLDKKWDRFCYFNGVGGM